jgi:hypothetical protein
VRDLFRIGTGATTADDQTRAITMAAGLDMDGLGRVAVLQRIGQQRPHSPHNSGAIPGADVPVRNRYFQLPLVLVAD